ncbi:MAG: sulfotransferase [Actinomycetales bacterium]|nr:sulfotransferase [Actinomycetales bacterium]
MKLGEGYLLGRLSTCSEAEFTAGAGYDPTMPFKNYLDLRRLPNRIGIVLNRTVVPMLERRPLAPAASGPTHPVVFMLGPPRCGSTLLVQTLVSNLDVSYISNRHAAWFGAPWIIERFARPRPPQAGVEHRSRHGVTEGPSGPSECGPWWRRFHPGDWWETPELASFDAKGFARSLALYSKVSGRPVIFKNLYASLRIPAIVKAVPNAVFIQIRRDEEDVARSILKVRQDVYGTTEAWWSMKPRDWESTASLPPEEQVRRQIAGVERHIREGLATAAVSDRRLLPIEYQTLCDDPGSVVEAVSRFLTSAASDSKGLER